MIEILNRFSLPLRVALFALAFFSAAPSLADTDRVSSVVIGVEREKVGPVTAGRSATVHVDVTNRGPATTLAGEVLLVIAFPEAFINSITIIGQQRNGTCLKLYNQEGLEVQYYCGVYPLSKGQTRSFRVKATFPASTAGTIVRSRYGALSNTANTLSGLTIRSSARRIGFRVR